MPNSSLLHQSSSGYLCFLGCCISIFQMACHGVDFSKPRTELVIIKDNHGRPTEIYTLKDSLLHGTRILFFPGSKDTSVVETHENGTFHGAYRSFFTKNRLKLSGQYVHNEMSGLWYQYDERGTLLEEVTFSKNLENGPFKEYFPSGQMRVSGTYREGNYEDGLLLFYDESGKLMKKMMCAKGICRTKWKVTHSIK